MGSAERRANTAAATLPDNREPMDGKDSAAGRIHSELVVHGRNVEIPDHFRIHVADRLARVEKFDQKIIRMDVELFHERNPRQTGSCQRVEITCRSRGPVVRAEACADDFYKALELAVEKLERRFRHSADRRRVHHGRRTPTSTAAATAGLAQALLGPTQTEAAPDAPEDAAGAQASDGPGRVVRRKQHSATPMSIDDALLEMELVGHDFYLFADADTGCPSVVYRRHAYDYGVIKLGD